MVLAQFFFQKDMPLATSLSVLKPHSWTQRALTIPWSRCNSLLLRTFDQRTDDSGPAHSHRRKGSEANCLELSHWEHTQAGRRRSMFYKDMQWISEFFYIGLYSCLKIYILHTNQNLYVFQGRRMIQPFHRWTYPSLWTLSEEQRGREWAYNRAIFSGKRWSRIVRGGEPPHWCLILIGRAKENISGISLDLLWQVDPAGSHG